MDELTRDLIANRTNSRFEAIDRGDLAITFFPRPCRLKILMVVDGYPGSFLNISFSHSYFGLSAVLDTLRLNPEFFVKFDVTRAHRQTDTFKPDPVADPVAHSRYGPHFENFTFTQAGFDINAFHQIWFFGARSTDMELSDAEAGVVARWMDEKQGGVLAMGDHYDLGAALCRKIPRVRSMRKWTVADGVPSNSGANRHDTNLKGHNNEYTFDDESDDIPMKTLPKLYRLAGWSPFKRRYQPHPVLCGKDGIIDILPDHPHEGWVNEDADINLAATFTFPGYGPKPEYPNPGTQPRPEIIARAQIQADHTSGDFKGVVNAKTFGCIGAYEGHDAAVGRVVVDSTWHHWFDVNLTGRPISALDSLPHDATNPKTLGFLATPAGLVALARIQNYFRNVAMWLAPPAQQACMFARATWGSIIRYPAVERIDISLPLWELGEIARDAIGRRASQCMLTKWLPIIIPKELIRVFEERIPEIDPNPCLTCPPFELLEQFVLGGITRELLTYAYAVADAKRVDEKEVTRRFEAGTRLGITELAERLDASVKRTSRLSNAITKLRDVQINVEAVRIDDERERPSPKAKVANAIRRTTGKTKK